MRTKLTAPHPRPSFTERAPIRPGAPRRPRPAAPAASAESPARGRSGDDARKSYSGKAGERDRPASTSKRADGERKPYAGKTGERSERPAFTGRRTDEERAPQRRSGEQPAFAGKRADGERPAYAGKRPDGERPAFAGKRPDGERRPFAGKPGERGERPAFTGKRADGERAPYAGRRDDAGDRGRPLGANGLERRAPYTPRNTPKPDADSRDRGGYRGDRSASDDAARGARSRAPGARDDSRANRSERPAFNHRDGARTGGPHAGNKPSRDGDARATDRPARAGFAGRSDARTPDRATGRPSAPRPAANAAPAKPAVPTPMREDDGTMRLSKRMSELGLCSRREADEWIEKGWVRVDGERIDTLGTRVRPEQQVEVIRQAREQQNRLVTILLHKPVGHVSGQPEDGHPPAAALIVPDNRWIHDASRHRFEHVHLRALAPAGRLDIDSTGLLVFTQDGRVAKQLIGESSDVEKEYLVRVSYGSLTEDVQSHFPEQKLALLRHGLSLDDVALRPAQVDWQNGEQLRFVLHEGKKRQIRRMCELVGLEVVGLKRVRIGQVMLGSLPVGEWRYLADHEVF